MIEYTRSWGSKQINELSVDPMMMHSGNGMWSASVLMPVAIVVFGVIIIAAAILTVRYLISTPGTGLVEVGESHRTENPLAQRYSRGEMTNDEYQHKLTLHRHR
jgi:putative membrane protein